MDLTSLCARFSLPAPHAIEPLPGGTVSRVWRLSCGEAQYLLRTLPDTMQGEIEWQIFCHLKRKNFAAAPELIPCSDGSPFAVDGNTVFQLQQFLPGRRPDPDCPGTAEKVAALVRSLDEALRDCPSLPSGRSFDLRTVWETGRANWAALDTGLSLSAADAAVDVCLSSSETPRQVIHGDLGLWNMIEGPDGHLSVVDFGQACMGDACFDAAAAFAGIFNHSSPPCRARAAGAYLDALHTDELRLSEQLERWAWQNLAKCACAPVPATQILMARRCLAAWQHGQALIQERSWKSLM